MKSRSLTLFALGGIAFVASAASCSLGLDESLIGQADATAPLPSETSTPDTSAPDAKPSNEAGIDATATDTCTRDADCKAVSACLKGRCDTTVNRCTYDICPQPDPCRASKCDVATDTCMPAVPVPLHEEFPTVDQVNFGPFRAVAVVAPFVFITTNSGVYAYSLQEPGIPKTPISVSGAPFVPSYVFAAGRRLYMVGSLAGSLQRRLPVAWLDVPRNPAAELRAESKFVPYNGQNANVVLPIAPDKLLLGYTSPGYAFAIAEPPFAATVGLNTVNVSQTYSFVGTSGSDRLVGIRQLGGPSAPAFALLTGAGTATGAVGPDQAIPSPGNVYSHNFGTEKIATSAKGMVAMAWPLNNPAPPFSGSVAAVRVAWILDDDKDTSFSSGDFFDVATFPAPGSPNYSNMAGPIAFADDRTLFATFATPAAPTTRVSTAFYVRGASADAGVGDAGAGALSDFPMQAGNIYGVAAGPGVGAIAANTSTNATVLHLVRQGCAP